MQTVPAELRIDAAPLAADIEAFISRQMEAFRRTGAILGLSGGIGSLRNPVRGPMQRGSGRGSPRLSRRRFVALAGLAAAGVAAGQALGWPDGARAADSEPGLPVPPGQPPPANEEGESPVQEIVAPETVDELRKAARQLAVEVQSSIRQMPNGLHVAPYDPTPLVDLFPHLQLAEGYRLASYQYIAGGNGNGFAFVIPAGRTLPAVPEGTFRLRWEDAGWPSLQPTQPFLPGWVRGDIGSFLLGDGSPASYFEASLLVREARELGAMWHGMNWGTHSILTQMPESDPFLYSGGGPGSKVEWTWHEPVPEEWGPMVTLRADGQAEVLFHTTSSLHLRRILRYIDTFSAGAAGPSYDFRTQSTELADGGPGFMF